MLVSNLHSCLSHVLARLKPLGERLIHTVVLRPRHAHSEHDCPEAVLHGDVCVETVEEGIRSDCVMLTEKYRLCHTRLSEIDYLKLSGFI